MDNGSSLVSVDIDKIKDLLIDKGWSSYKLSRMMGLDYSFVFRVLKGEANPGSKFVAGFVKICNSFGLDVNNYIFLNIPLFKNKL
jgi:transcriptional regulator with XRE-family HTH domain